MPVICRFYGILIRMYIHDHGPPHFHAVYQGQIAVFDIDPPRLAHGSLPARARRLVLEWARLHREELLADWRRAVSDEPLVPIPPLE
jgi:hypothetical protein